MANSLFQIERSRKVEITIPGYDPVLETQKLGKRFKRLRDRQKGKEALAVKKQQEALRTELKEQEAALDELNKGAGLAQAGPEQSRQGDTEDNLFE